MMAELSSESDFIQIDIVGLYVYVGKHFVYENPAAIELMKGKEFVIIEVVHLNSSCNCPILTCTLSPVMLL